LLDRTSPGWQQLPPLHVSASSAVGKLSSLAISALVLRALPSAPTVFSNCGISAVASISARAIPTTAETVKASPTTVGKVRAKLEETGDVRNFRT
jgi:hypothetical protein